MNASRILLDIGPGHESSISRITFYGLDHEINLKVIMMERFSL